MSRDGWKDGRDDDVDEEFDNGVDDDIDAPQARDLEDDETAEELAAEMICPSCGAAVIEDAQKCPHCGDWITPVHPGGRGMKRWLLLAAVALMLLAMLRFIL